jgi:chromosomal replication initiator protein
MARATMGVRRWAPSVDARGTPRGHGDVQMQAKQLWQTVLSDMEGRLSRSTFDNWLRQTSIVDFKDDVATIAVANRSGASTLQSRYGDDIEHILSEIVGRPIRAEFTVLNAPSHDEVRPRAVRAVTTPVRRDQTTKRSAPEVSQPTQRFVAPSRQLELAPTPSHGLNPRYVYEHYVVGSSNRFAHAASLSVAEQPGGKFNPFFIYGGVGLGKTHLLHAIGHKAIELRPELSVTYVSSEKFTNDVINAIRQQRMEEFRARYRTIDILMIDDIQFIGGKDATQEEFFHTFNTLYQNGKQVVISSDKPPKAIGGLEERLRSRFEGGLIADVQLPDYEMRTAILRAKGDDSGIALPPDVIEYVAQRDQSNIRELEGALNKIIALAEFTGRPLSLHLAMEAVTNAGPGGKGMQATAETVLDAVAAYFKVSLSDLRGRSRSKGIVLPRHIAMYLLREETGATFVDIGQDLGGRDHTTVMNGIDNIERAIETDTALRSHLMKIRETVFSRSFG